MNNQSNVFLLKQNSAGDTIWNKILRLGIGYWIEETVDKGFIISGGLPDAFIIKTDSAGNIMWQKIYNNPYGAIVRCAKETNDSGYIVALRWGVDFSQNRIKLIKTNSLGDSIWQNIYNGPASENPREVTLVNNTGYIVIGTSSAGFVNSFNIFIIRIDTVGDTLWTRTIGNPNYADAGDQIQPTSDGGFILAGWTESFTMGQRRESLVMKLDLNGDTQWQKLYSSLGSDESYAIRIIPNGYVIAGYSDTLNNGDGRAKIRILDNSGNVIRQKSFKPTKEEAYFNSVEPTSDGGFILCGETHNSNGAGFVYIVKTDSLGNAIPIGISNNNNYIPSEFNLYQNYPNPFNSQTIISFDIKETSSVILSIYDILGKEIILLNGEVNAGRKQILFDAEKSKLSTGVYFCKLTINPTNSNKPFSFIKKIIYVK